MENKPNCSDPCCSEVCKDNIEWMDYINQRESQED